jgi:hypothetical protein
LLNCSCGFDSGVALGKVAGSFAPLVIFAPAFALLNLNETLPAFDADALSPRATLANLVLFGLAHRDVDLHRWPSFPALL